MEEKLKSITSRTHWSLLLKALGFALAWSILPFWLFVVFGLAFYFVPFFEPRRMFLPLALLFVLAFFVPHGFFATLFLGASYFLILGIKDLTFIDRGVAYEAMFFLLFISSSLLLFSHAVNTERVSSFVLTALIACGAYVLLRGLVRYDAPSEDITSGQENWRAVLACRISALILWQGMVATLFLPMNFYFQSALVLFFASALTEILRDYASGRLRGRTVAMYGGMWLVGTALVLFLTTWSV